MSGRLAPVRVLWLTKGLGFGGTERLLVNAAAHIDPDRYQIEVAYVLPHKDAFVSDLRASGIRVHCVGNAGRGWAWPLRLRQLMRDRSYAMVHTHAPLPAAAARLLARRSKPVFVHTEHNMWSRYRWPTYAANAATFGRNAAVIAVSAGVRDSVARPAWAPWRRLPPVEVLHHGIDPSSVHSGPAARAEARRRLELPTSAPVVGTVANFTPKKDQRSLLDAMRQSLLRYPDLVLVLVGTGPLEEPLRARADGLGIAEQVRFAGSRDDVPAILPAFDVFALSSRHEGLPIALLEAMAAGVPCAVTAVGGIPEVVTDGAEGFLVPPQDPAALAVAIGKLLDDDALRAEMGARAQARTDAFGIRRAAERIEAVYDEVLGCG